MEYLTSKGELIDKIVSAFSKLSVGKKFTPNSYSIVSHAYETTVRIEFGSKVSICAVFINSAFSNLEITIKKYFIYKKHNVLTLTTEKEFNDFNKDSEDVMARLYRAVINKFNQLNIDYSEK